MILKLMCIFDSAAEVYMRPFCAQSLGEALRAFADLVNDPDHPIAKHPDDYTLMHVGVFDQTTGIVTAKVPYSLGNGQEFRARHRVAELEEVADA